jgi:hypothetical protein
MTGKLIGILFVSVALALTVGFIIWPGQYTGAHERGAATRVDLFLVLMAVWAGSPYVGTLFVMRSIRGWSIAERIAFALTLLACAFGPVLVVATLLRMGGAQGGLGFLFLPFLQWVVVGAMAIFLFVVRHRRSV